MLLIMEHFERKSLHKKNVETTMPTRIEQLKRVVSKRSRSDSERVDVWYPTGLSVGLFLNGLSWLCFATGTGNGKKKGREVGSDETILCFPHLSEYKTEKHQKRLPRKVKK